MRRLQLIIRCCCMILVDTATVCHVMHRGPRAEALPVHDEGGRRGGRNMHLVVVYCAAHRAILRTAYHIARDGTVAGQSSFASSLLLDRRSDGRLLCWLWLCCCGALKVPAQGSCCAQPGRLGQRGPGYWTVVTITHENHDRPCDEAHVAASRPRSVLCLESMGPCGLSD